MREIFSVRVIQFVRKKAAAAAEEGGEAHPTLNSIRLNGSGITEGRARQRLSDLLSLKCNSEKDRRASYCRSWRRGAAERASPHPFPFPGISIPAFPSLFPSHFPRLPSPSPSPPGSCDFASRSSFVSATSLKRAPGYGGGDAVFRCVDDDPPAVV